MRVLIVDDERLARLRLAGLVAELGPEFPEGSLAVREADSAAAALEALKAQGADVLLLDIRMPGLDGLQLAGQLQDSEDRPQIIFVTAQPQHALKAFDLEAADYLTKPVTRDRLKKALQRAAQRVRAAASQARSPSAVPDILVVERGRVLRVRADQALYFRAEDKYVTLRTAYASHLLEQPLAELEARLGERFVRVHRNAIVSRRAISALERRGQDDDGTPGWAVRVEPTGEWLAVSRRLVAQVRESLSAPLPAGNG
jgi:two-component system response regulator AlgR